MTSIRPDINEVRIKHTVYGVPPDRTEHQIQSRGEYYKWRIYVDGDPSTLQKIEKVVYRLHPSFPRPLVESSNWQRNFEYQVFGYGSFQLEFHIYVKDNPRPITGPYFLDISKSDDVGYPVTFA